MISVNSSVLNTLKRSRIQFSEEDNHILLTEILANNPYADPSKWVVIHSNFCKFTGKILSVRGVKEHMQYIIKNFEKREKENRARSGVEEEDHLLQEVLDLINNILKEKNKLKEESQSSEKGKMLRDNCAQKFFGSPYEQMGHGHECSEEDNQFVSIEPQVQNKPDIQEQSQNEHESEQLQIPHKEAQIGGPNRKRKRRAAKNNLKKTTLEYLEEKNCQKNRIRMRELDIEEHKQKLEEQRLKIDRERLEFEAEKFGMEKEERKYLIKLMQSQQVLISSLFKQNPAHFAE